MTLMWPIMTMAMCTRYMHICECLYGTKDGHEYGHRQGEGTGTGTGTGTGNRHRDWGTTTGTHTPVSVSI